MAQGPGKYDDLCTMVRERSNAMGAIVLVLNGDRGTGFSVQVLHQDMAKALPDLLRHIASQIDETENPVS